MTHYSIWDMERLFGLPPLAALALLESGQLRGRKVRGCWQVAVGDLVRWRQEA